MKEGRWKVGGSTDIGCQRGGGGNSRVQRFKSIRHAGRTIASVDPLGLRTTTAYDQASRSIASINPLNEITTTVYNSAGRTIATVDPLALRNSTIYDAAGRAIAEINPLNEIITTLYDAAGRTIATIDALANRTTTLYDAAGREIASTNPLNETTTTVYDDAGRIIASVDPLALRSSTTYDASGRSTEAINPLGEITTTVYDDAGRAIATVDPLALRSSSVYDAAGQLAAAVNALGQRSTTVYDLAGRIIAAIDPLSNHSTTVYDAAGRVTASVNALTYRTTSIYDAGGRQISLLNANGQRNTTVYDDAGRPIRTVNPLGNIVTSGYDAAGRRTLRVDARGNRTTYAYDDAGRNASRLYPDGTRITWTHDANGNPTLVEQSDGRWTRTYDSVNRVVRVAEADAGILTFNYDAGGRRESMIDTEGGRTTYTHDDASRVRSLVNPDGERTTFSYDPAGRRTLKVLANETRASYTYDDAGRITLLGNLKSTGEVISSFDYQYDAAGKRTRVVEADGSRVTWTYDVANQLTGEQRSGANAYDHAFSYDPVGNRLVKIEDGARTTSTYDAANRLKTAEDASGATTFTWDADGNQRSIEEPSGDVTTQTWSYENKLIGIEQPTGEIVTYSHALVKRDDTEQRITKGDGATFVRFVWDEDRIIAEADDLNAVQVRYDFEPDGYGNLISQRRDTETDYHHFNALGSSTELTDAGEVVTDDYIYEAFGDEVAQTGASPNPHRWVGEQGYYRDEESSLYSVGQRTYRPATGRWLSNDSLRDDEENLYRYVGNNVVNAIDPSGMIICASTKAEAEEFAFQLKRFRGTQREDCHQTMRDVSVHDCCGCWYIQTEERDALLLSDYGRNHYPLVEDKPTGYNQFMRASGATTHECWEKNVIDPKGNDVRISAKAKKCVLRVWEEETLHRRFPVKVDIGGEGLHLDAINLNPAQGKQNTPKEGDRIPRQYFGHSTVLDQAVCGAKIDTVYVERSFRAIPREDLATPLRRNCSVGEKLFITDLIAPNDRQLARFLGLLNTFGDETKRCYAKVVSISLTAGPRKYYIYEIEFIKPMGAPPVYNHNNFAIKQLNVKPFDKEVRPDCPAWAYPPRPPNEDGLQQLKD